MEVLLESDRDGEDQIIKGSAQVERLGDDVRDQTDMVQTCLWVGGSGCVGRRMLEMQLLGKDKEDAVREDMQVDGVRTEDAE